MQRSTVRTGLCSLAIMALLAACGDSTSPDTRPDSGLNILRLAASAPPLEASELSFYAVQGQGREGILYFEDENGQRGDEYLRLKFDGESLVTDATGALVAPGDSVLIHITVVDPARIQFQFEPAGIVFNPVHMPELRIRYDKSDHDFNEDGSEDSEDADIEGRLALWRQETLGGIYVKLPTQLTVDVDEAEGLVPGFSRFAIAY